MKNDYRLILRHAFLPLMLTLLLPALAQAATLTVALDGTGQYSAIQSAINAAQPGDTVLIGSGTYSGAGNRDLDFAGKNLTVASRRGAAATIIDCGGVAPGLPNAANHRGFFIHSGETAAVISGLTIKNGYEAQNNNLHGAGYGGGIFIDNSSASVQNCIISGNMAEAGGGGVYSSTGSGTNTITLSGCTVSGNTAGTAGGGVDNETGLNSPPAGSIDTITLTNCFISKNTAGSASSVSGLGGGLYNNNADVSTTNTITLSGCTISGNSAQSASSSGTYNTFGGGVFNDNAGSNNLIQMSACQVLGNASLNDGGGIYDNNSGATNTLTNCVVSGNSALGNGGGILIFNHVSNSATTLTNDSFSANTASLGAGVHDSSSVSDTITLTNCILFGDTSAEIGTNSATTVVCTYSDVQGGFAGAGNINADPLFVYAPYNLHLKTGSPAIGLGTATGAPATDKDGTARANPPTIGAYEGAQVIQAHILWDNTSGQASIWNYNVLSGVYTDREYGPFTGWTAEALADGGTDGKTRVLWNNTSGQASIWNLNNATGIYTDAEYGPFGNWTAKSISVAPDNTTHLLWDNSSGQISIWNYDLGLGGYHDLEYGPFPTWTARAIADGPDGKLRVLWNKTDGTMSLWSLDNNTGVYSHAEYGPFGSWTAKAISVGLDNTTHVLWTNTDGTASLWNDNTVTGVYTHREYGPFGSWSAQALSDGADGKTEVLWDNTNGQMSFWDLNNITGVYSNAQYGPFPNWTALTLSGVP